MDSVSADVALQGGAGLRAFTAGHVGCTPDSGLYVHEGSRFVFPNFRRPQGTVQVNPFIGVNIKQTSAKVLVAVADHLAENAFSGILHNVDLIAFVAVQSQCGDLLKARVAQCARFYLIIVPDGSLLGACRKIE